MVHAAHKGDTPSNLCQLPAWFTIEFAGTTKVLAQQILKYYRISQFSLLGAVARRAAQHTHVHPIHAARSSTARRHAN